MNSYKKNKAWKPLFTSVFVYRFYVLPLVISHCLFYQILPGPGMKTLSLRDCCTDSMGTLSTV